MTELWRVSILYFFLQRRFPDHIPVIARKHNFRSNDSFIPIFVPAGSK
jgi:hypothetical protein